MKSSRWTKPFEAALDAREGAAAARRRRFRRRRNGRTSSGRSRTRASSRCARLQKAGVPVFRAALRGSSRWPTVRARHVDRARRRPRRAAFWKTSSRETGLEVRRRRRAARGGRRHDLKPSHAHRPVARREQHAGRLDEMDCSSSTASTTRSSRPRTSTATSRRSTTPSCCPAASRRETIVSGLDPEQQRQDSCSGRTAWARPAGRSSRQWVRDGGTLVAIGSAVETARELLDLPIAKVLPEADPSAARTGGGRRARAPATATTSTACCVTRSPVPRNLDRRRCASASSNPSRCSIARGRCCRTSSTSPIRRVRDAGGVAGLLRVGSGVSAEPGVRHPSRGRLALPDDRADSAERLAARRRVPARSGQRRRVPRRHGLRRDLGSQVDFRAQPRATFKLLFNAMFHGPSREVSAAELAKLAAPPRGSR